MSITSYFIDLIVDEQRLNKKFKNDIQLEIAENLKNTSGLDDFPKLKEKIEEEIESTIEYLKEIKSPRRSDKIKVEYLDINKYEKNAIDEEYFELNFQQLFKNYSRYNCNMMVELSKTENINCATAFVNTFKQIFVDHTNGKLNFSPAYTINAIFPECLLNVYKLDVIENESAIKDSIKWLASNADLLLGHIDITPELLAFDESKQENAKSLDEEIAEKSNETIAENATNLSDVLENVKLLMTRFVMENKGPEETEALKEEISKGVKECQSDPKTIDDIKGTLTTFIFFAGMPGLENKISELRKIIDNATSKDEIDI